MITQKQFDEAAEACAAIYSSFILSDANSAAAASGAASGSPNAASDDDVENKKKTADICRKYLKVPNSTPLKQKIRKKDLLKRIQRLENIVLTREGSND